MKRNIIFLVLCCAVLLSCKKDKKAPDLQPQSKERQLSFTINGFTQSTGPVTNSVNKKLETNAIQDSSMLTYVLLDSTNTVVKIVNQSSSDASFGTFTDNVLPGTYYVAFLASELPSNTQTIKTKLTYKDKGRFNYMSTTTPSVAAPWRDLLYVKSKIVVANNDLALSFTLTRIVGKIQLEVLDAIPSGAPGLSLLFTEFNTYFSVITGKFITSSTGVIGGQSITVLPGTTLNSIIAYTATLNTSLPVTIVSYHTPRSSTDQTTIIKKTFGITCQANKLTIVSGNLFSNNGVFNISVGDWNPSVTIPF
jgi:hypothetical protein